MRHTIHSRHKISSDTFQDQHIIRALANDSTDARMRTVMVAASILAAITVFAFGATAKTTEAVTGATIQLPFSYDFRVNGTLDEAKTELTSSSPYWWVTSGGQLVLSQGIGKTLSGNLPSNNRWSQYYAAGNPVATDNGTHPQNVFQMFLRDQVQNPSEQIYVRQINDNLSNSVNRNPWNGISLLLRRTDDSNYYYAGMRADGGVVIKKKVNGTYQTLGYKKVFPGTYNKTTSPNLIPKGSWIGLKAVISNDASGNNPKISLYMDQGKTGTWQLVLEAVDDLSKYGTGINTSGFVGIQSDFADAEFDDFLLSEIVSSTGTSTVPPTIPPVPQVSLYGLTPNRVIQETGALTETVDPNWWVNSGGYFNVANSIGSTNEGDLPSGDRWRTLYAASNPLDTDQGLHPQNIFRLVSTSLWGQYIQQGYFKIDKDNLSASPNREGHNGLLFFNRYVDGMNLYYTGIRNDGNAVIKKKINGTYYTMVMNKVYAGTYDRTSNPNLLPHDTWLGLRSVVKNLSGGGVSIDLYLDQGKTGNWKLIAHAVDDGTQYGPPITQKSSVGIRTDFMDVKLSDYSLVELP